MDFAIFPNVRFLLTAKEDVVMAKNDINLDGRLLLIKYIV